MPMPTHIAGRTNTTNQEEGKQDQEEDRKLPDVEHPASAPRTQTNTSDAGTSAQQSAQPKLRQLPVRRHHKRIIQCFHLATMK